MKETTDGDYDSGEIEYLDDGGISVPLIEEELVVLKRKVVRERVIVRKNAQTENIEVFASRVGLGVNPAVMLAIADRLAQPEGQWRPFAATGCAAFAFPRTTLN